MRWIVCAVLLVGACFSDNGGITSATSAPASSSSGGSTDAQAATTSTATSGVPTTGAPDVPTTSADATDSADTGTSAPGGCDPPCSPCETCVADACVANTPESKCIPPADTCDDVVWGLQGGTCYGAEPGLGKCDDDGVCVAACSEKGAVIALCQDAACVRGEHPCVAGKPSADVKLGNLCVTDNTTTTGCNLDCNIRTDQIETKHCGQAGACLTTAVMDCAGYACDPVNAQCYVSCAGDGDCAVNYGCADDGTCLPL